MDHFHGICHGNCDLMYVGGVVELRKLGFRGLIGQLDVKMANFRGLIAKIGHLRPILTSRPLQRPIFMDYGIGIVPYGMLEGF